MGQRPDAAADGGETAFHIDPGRFQQRLAEAEAAAALRARLENADSELTAMTMALEEQRRRAEETLTLLAAAREAEEDLDARLAAALLRQDETEAALQRARDAAGNAETLQDDLAQAQATAEDLRSRLAALLEEQGEAEITQEELRDRLTAALAAQKAAEAEAGARLSEAEQRAALLSEARSELSQTEARASEAERQRELLNQQVAALRSQLSQLQGLLDEARESDAEAQVQLQNLGSELNAALARVAAEERRRRQLEEEERRRLEAQAEDLERYRSEFFGRLREVIGDQDGIRIEGDRFVFSSEVLFAPGEARLSPLGEGEIANIAGILQRVMSDIPPGIDWILRVDGHTDDTPLRPGARFADNWELSQARALSVVRFLVEDMGIPPQRLSANGFGEYQPVDPADSPEARAQNRRIELKLTER